MVDEEDALLPDGPIREKNPEVVSAEGPVLLDGFEWVTMDLTDEHQVWTVLSRARVTAHHVPRRRPRATGDAVSRICEF